MKIGVVSDTHNFFDGQIPALLQGVAHILHGGDIGHPHILERLREIAPVTAVCGNTDDPAFGYRPVEIVELGGRKFLLQHIVNPRSMGEGLPARLQREQPDVVVFGHTHRPFAEVIGGILFFNPGYAGKARFGMERTVAVLECGPQGIPHRFFTLAGA